MVRRLALVVAAASALIAVSMPAQGATHEGTALLPYGDYFSVGGTVDGQHASVTVRGFMAACLADFMAGGNSATTRFLSSPLNGVDGYVVDLGSEKMGAFSATGPGASPVGPAVPNAGVFSGDIQLTSYDLDLDFYTSIDTGCYDANYNDSPDAECYSTSPEPDERTPCIVGHEDDDFVVHGARYVIAAAALNFTGRPLPITIKTP